MNVSRFDVAEADLVALTTEVWTTMLGKDLSLAPEGQAAAGATLDGVVSITGAWCGAVVVRVSRDLAASIAATMFELGDARPEQGDLQDAIGELTNTIGGNIKGLMPGLCHLSLPAVVEGSDVRLRVPGAAIAADLRFECDSQPVIVRLVAAPVSDVPTLSS